MSLEWNAYEWGYGKSPAQPGSVNGATIAEGAMAGFIATLPTSIVMLAGHRMLPHSERYPLPPEQITAEMADRTGAQKAGWRPLREVLTVLAHFSFGAGAGSLYIPLSKVSPMPSFLTGLIYCFLVWFVSYQGWIPRARILPPASREPPRRNLLMIFAHFVWGGRSGLASTAPDTARLMHVCMRSQS